MEAARVLCALEADAGGVPGLDGGRLSQSDLGDGGAAVSTSSTAIQTNMATQAKVNKVATTLVARVGQLLGTLVHWDIHRQKRVEECPVSSFLGSWH